jgi:hypothetical protein
MGEQPFLPAFHAVVYRVHSLQQGATHSHWTSLGHGRSIGHPLLSTTPYRRFHLRVRQRCAECLH